MTRRIAQSPRVGFTLIELLVVMLIIVVLAAILIPVAGKVRESARRAESSSEISQIATAIATYKTKTGASYIPSGGSGKNGTFQLRGTYYGSPGAGQVGTGSPEAIVLESATSG